MCPSSIFFNRKFESAATEFYDSETFWRFAKKMQFSGADLQLLKSLNMCACIYLPSIIKM